MILGAWLLMALITAVAFARHRQELTIGMLVLCMLAWPVVAFMGVLGVIGDYVYRADRVVLWRKK